MGRAGSAQWAGPTRGAMAAPVRDREALQRLSFLFQAAHWVLPHSPALARFYCSTQRGAARRLVLRMRGAAPHSTALPELPTPTPLPLPAEAPPPRPGHAHRPCPRGQPSMNPTRRQSTDGTSDWSAQKLPLTNQEALAAEINLPLFHIWY
ncbi:ribonuclease P protein subunit p21 isoform X1 [Falco biarmicus]|uniref:ribonuclease P protein subunit p21 isoform X1 n=1 Tax=Falco rusticolus TaxID=120794 RepID=UPI001886AB06|nr:ribonuclease P protein subunit p21 isoform X1 [Falco rusticolus]XP_055553933.1 ribonuclease P protein subunit p21 isoform X1 [Falco cherrug]XP_055648535.1 ribonuclease P protein subunit p21 isoform X1 [Falco peregrinus]XP_056179028.1 ribonuclease P protein subunit p21 isoform X1 [Falco biarmicus]